MMRLFLLSIFCVLWSYDTEAKTKFSLGNSQIEIELPKAWKVAGKTESSILRSLPSADSAVFMSQCVSVRNLASQGVEALDAKIKECEAKLAAQQAPVTVKAFRIKGPRTGDEITFELLSQTDLTNVEALYLSYAIMISPEAHIVRKEARNGQNVSVWFTVLPQVPPLINYIVDIGEERLAISAFCSNDCTLPEINPGAAPKGALASHRVIEEILTKSPNIQATK